MKLKGSKTEKNLLAAFAGESQARNRYTFYASAAAKEGLQGVAGVFLETADNEMMHAKRFFEQLEGSDVEITAAFPSRIGDTTANLAAAAAGEHEEAAAVYPAFGKTAEEEGLPVAAALFRGIARIEAEHEKRYQALLARVKAGTLFKRERPIRWKCLKCGHIHEGSAAPDRCPVCAHPQGWFVPAEENY